MSENLNTNTKTGDESELLESKCSKKIKVWLKRAARHQAKSDELGESGKLELSSVYAGRASGYRIAANELDHILNS